MYHVWNAIKSVVHEATAKCANKAWYVKPYLYAVLILKTIWWYSPYKRALAILAYFEYQETYMYKERKRLFGEDWATKMFVDNNELKMFYKKLVWKHHLKALFIPYCYIGSMV